MNQTFDDLPLELLHRAVADDSMSEPPGVRKRKSRSTGQRVRTGCLTCKARRVKCDERRPTCKRCRDSRRTCGGYEDRSETPEQSGAERQSTPSMVAASGRSRSQRRNQRDVLAFDFFVSHTVPALDYYFPSDFWNRIVLPMSQAEPAIRHAAVAVGAAHLSHRSSFGASDAGAGADPEDPEVRVEAEAGNERFTLESYNRAIQALNSKLTADGPQAVRVVLVSCVLFIGLESLNNRPERSIRHFESGRRIFNDWSRRIDGPELGAPTDPIHDEMRKHLGRTFSRLHQVLVITGSGDMSEEILAWSGRQDPLLTGMNMFRDLVDVQDALDDISKLIFRFLRISQPHKAAPLEQVPAEIFAQRQQLSDGLHAFDERFSAFAATSAPAVPSPRFVQSAAVVRIHSKLLHIMLGESIGVTPTSIDRYDPDFEEIVAQCELVLQTNPPAEPGTESPFTFRRQTDAGGPQYAPRTPTFTLACGVSSALYFVVQTSRSAPLRERAVALLAAANTNDGVWSSASVAKIATRVQEAQAAEAPAPLDLSVGLLELGKRLRIFEDEGEVHEGP